MHRQRTRRSKLEEISLSDFEVASASTRFAVEAYNAMTAYVSPEDLGTEKHARVWRQLCDSITRRRRFEIFEEGKIRHKVALRILASFRACRHESFKSLALPKASPPLVEADIARATGGALAAAECVFEASSYIERLGAKGHFADFIRAHKSIARGNYGTVEAIEFKTAQGISRNAFVAKVALDDSEDGDIMAIREALIGLAAVNSIREIVPNFVFTIGVFYDSRDRAVILYENLAPAPSIYAFLTRLPVQSKEAVVHSLLTIAHVVLAIGVAWEHSEFVHGDLHLNNILLRDVGKMKFPTFVRYPSGHYVQCIGGHLVPTIVDFGMSRAIVDDADGTRVSMCDVNVKHAQLDAFPSDRLDLIKFVAYMIGTISIQDTSLATTIFAPVAFPQLGRADAERETAKYFKSQAINRFAGGMFPPSVSRDALAPFDHERYVSSVIAPALADLGAGSLITFTAPKVILPPPLDHFVKDFKTTFSDFGGVVL